MSFTTQLKVRFGDEDHARIVYYPRFFDFFHRVFEDFFEEAGKTYRQVLTEDHAGWPAVKAEAEFASPARFGDVLDVTLTVSRIGEKSATFEYRGVQARDGRLVVTGTVTCVCVDMRTFESREIPETYRKLFEAHRA